MTVQSSTFPHWVVPVGGLAAATLVAGGIWTATASTPHRAPTASQLVSAVRAAATPTLSGTLVATSTLVLPARVFGTTSGSGLRQGVNSVRLWSRGDADQRITMLQSDGEVDYVRHGQDVWTYDSSTNTADHQVAARSTNSGASSILPVLTAAPVITPAQIGQWAMSATGRGTAVTTAGEDHVAGRLTHRLSLVPPRGGGSRVGRVVLSVDAATSTPLAAAVFARGSQRAALTVAFTSVRFERPADAVFAFTPPRTSRVHRDGPSRGDYRMTAGGWATVLVHDETAPTARDQQDGAMTGTRRVSGPWGSGWLLTTDLMCVLVRSDGRVVFGVVDPDVLYRAVV